MRLAIMEKHAPLLNTLAEKTKILETLVEAEVEDGWDWRVGIEEQKAARSEMNRVDCSFDKFVDNGRFSEEEWDQLTCRTV